MLLAQRRAEPAHQLKAHSPTLAHWQLRSYSSTTSRAMNSAGRGLQSVTVFGDAHDEADATHNGLNSQRSRHTAGQTRTDLPV
jgi:hypothetical protein